MGPVIIEDFKAPHEQLGFLDPAPSPSAELISTTPG
jgi:hypothetical protein